MLYVCAAGVLRIEGARRAQLLTASSIIIIFKLCSRERTHRRRTKHQYGAHRGRKRTAAVCRSQIIKLHKGNSLACAWLNFASPRRRDEFSSRTTALIWRRVPTSYSLSHSLCAASLSLSDELFHAWQEAGEGANYLQMLLVINFNSP